MVPVDHVARLVVASVFNPPASGLGVCHVTSHPRLRFNEYLAALETYGYEVPQVDYTTWSEAVEAYVANPREEDHALLGLYHMVTSDMPANTKAPELDDSNAAAALRADNQRTGQDLSAGGAVTEATVGIYLSYLIQRGFMPSPPTKGRKVLPHISLSEAQIKALEGIGGRGGGR
ncbi:large subunit of alpha-aminoadipate reductase [Elasticomyces elasticus]|nr:large subunit of alpha-aminoadipate reductase [Elasticomyces elasticus]KAK5001154.1 large subunit of alpha-aminoadipate reductase [Elasticomyces elasticus]